MYPTLIEYMPCTEYILYTRPPLADRGDQAVVVAVRMDVVAAVANRRHMWRRAPAARKMVVVASPLQLGSMTM